MADRLLLSGSRRLPLASDAVDERDHPPCLRELRVRIARFEQGDERRRLALHLRTPAVQVVRREVTDEQACKQRVGAQPLVTVCQCACKRLVQKDVRPGKLSGFHHRLAQVGQELEAIGILFGQDRGGAA